MKNHCLDKFVVNLFTVYFYRALRSKMSKISLSEVLAGTGVAKILKVKAMGVVREKPFVICYRYRLYQKFKWKMKMS